MKNVKDKCPRCGGELDLPEKWRFCESCREAILSPFLGAKVSTSTTWDGARYHRKGERKR